MYCRDSETMLMAKIGPMGLIGLPGTTLGHIVLLNTTWCEQSGCVSFTSVLLLLIMQPVSCDVASGPGVLHTPMSGIC